MSEALEPRLIKLVLDTDIGSDVDDAFALAFAARHPAIELLAVTTVWGDVEWAAALVLRLLAELDVTGVPVAAGEAVRPRPAGWIGSGEAILPRGSSDRRVDSRHAVEVIRDIVTSSPDPVWLASIGTATNVAMALREHPELRDRLAGITVMGGRHLAPGATLGPAARTYGVDPASLREHNFSDDVAAAVAVCDSGLDVRVCDFNLTYEATLGRDDLAAIRRAPSIGPSLATMLEDQLERTGRMSTPMFDPICLTQPLGDRFLAPHDTPMRATEVDGHVRFEPSEIPTTLRLAGRIDTVNFRKALLDVLGARGYPAQSRI